MTDTTLATIEAGIQLIDPARPDTDELAYLRTTLEALRQRVNAALAELDTKMVQTIKATGKPIEFTVDDCGNVRRFWLGPRKTVKCRDPKRTCEALFQFDVDDVLDCLSANAFKYGAVKKLLAAAGKPELYEELFETILTDALETEPAGKQLQQLDTRYLSR